MADKIALTGVPDFDDLKIVKAGKTTIVLTGAAIDTFTIPHNLGFTPTPYVFLGDSTISGSPLTSTNLPLPTWVQAVIGGGTVSFTLYLFCSTDGINLYVQSLNAISSTLSFDISYYLMAKRSQLST